MNLGDTELKDVFENRILVMGNLAYLVQLLLMALLSIGKLTLLSQKWNLGFVLLNLLSRDTQFPHYICCFSKTTNKSKLMKNCIYYTNLR